MKRFADDLILTTCTLLLTLAWAATAYGATERPSLFHVSRLRTGQFYYQDSKEGKTVGFGVLTIRKIASSADYRLAADLKFQSGAHFQTQKWEAIVRPNFAPVSATLSFGDTSSIAPLFNLRYSSSIVSGLATTRGKSRPASSRSVRATVPSDIVDQRVDWAAVLAGPLRKGMRYGFHVYDPNTGVSPVSVRVSAPEQIRTPAGSFLCYRITYRTEKQDKTEQYVVFATRDEPRMMVREDFPDGVISMLTDVK